MQIPRLSALVSLLLAVALSLNGADLYVDGSRGSDKNVGQSPEQPFKTIQKAANTASPGDTVLIRAGTYRESVRIKIAGTAEKPVLFRPYREEQVIVSGTEPIETLKASGADWKIHQGKIYSLELTDLFASKLHQSEQLFVDGRMLNEARHPNIQPGCDAMQPGRYFTMKRLVSETNVTGQNPWGAIGNGGARRVVIESDDLLEPDGAWEKATIWIKPEEAQSWGFGRVGPVLSYRNGQLEFDIYERTDSFFKFAPGTRFFLFNLLRSLDAPGEWWIDRAAKRLYIWMPKGDSPAKHRIEMKRRDYAFDLSESSHVTLRGLHIFAATITTDNAYGDGRGGGAWETGNRGSLLMAKGNATAHHIVLDGIRAQYVSHFLGTWGFAHGQWITSSGILLSGEDHVLQNSAIEYSAGNGVSLFGFRHKVINNIIHDVNCSAALASGIYFHETPQNGPKPWIFPTDIEIAHNTIYRGGWGLIDGSNLFSSNSNNPARIHHNFLDSPGLMTKDVGAIRFVGHRGGSFSEPPLPNGTRLDHNLVRGCVSALGNGLYFDFSNGYIADHNIVWHGVNFANLNDAGDLLFINNTGWTLLGGPAGNVPGDTNAWRLKGVIVRNNICNHGTFGADAKPDPSFQADHNLFDADLRTLVVDLDGSDFRLREGAKAIDSGLPIPPYTDHFAGQAPDLGALEYGAEDWRAQAGANWAIEPAPSDLKASMIGNGTVTLTWKQSKPPEAGFVIERGYKTDHPNGGWEYLIVGHSGPSETRFTDVFAAPYREYFYRVRTTRSCYCEPIALKAGFAGSTRVSFEATEQFQEGRLAGQRNWVGVHGGNGPAMVIPDTFKIQSGPNGARRLAIDGQGSVAALGNLALVDAGFKPGQSKLNLSLRLGLKGIHPGDKEMAVRVLIGGLSYWRGPEDSLGYLELQRDGVIKWGWQAIGKLSDFARSEGTLVTISGTLDLAKGEASGFAINGQTLSVGPFPLGPHRDITNALWQISSSVPDPAASVYVDDLTLEVVQ